MVCARSRTQPRASAPKGRVWLAVRLRWAESALLCLRQQGAQRKGMGLAWEQAPGTLDLSVPVRSLSIYARLRPSK